MSLSLLAHQGCAIEVAPRKAFKSPLTLPVLGPPKKVFSGRQSGTLSRARSLKRLKIASVMASASQSKSVLVPIASGSEEIEAVTIIDTLRRAGAEVTVASVEDALQVEMSRKVKVVADKLISELEDHQFDLIALPGGMPGAERLRDSAVLQQLLKQQQASDGYVTAICAAPAVVLEAQGFLQGKKATSHPGFTDKLSNQSCIDSRVVIDGKVVTSRGPGTSLEFALSLVHQLFGKEKADEVAGPMVITDGLQY